jgi:hypothetical protein
MHIGILLLAFVGAVVFFLRPKSLSGPRDGSGNDFFSGGQDGSSSGYDGHSSHSNGGSGHGGGDG